MSSKLARYAAATAGVILVAGAILGVLFRGPGDVHAIVVSGVLAFLVQLAAFWVGQSLKQNLSARIGAGALLRFLVLVVFALLAAKVLAIPLTAALVSLAAFFFLTTLIDPLLIK